MATPIETRSFRCKISQTTELIHNLDITTGGDSVRDRGLEE